MLWSESIVTRKLRALCLIYAIFATCQSTEAYFEGCDHYYNVNPGYSYLQSPYYPEFYPTKTSCRYKFVAPLDHEIVVKCTINLAKGAQNCTSEYFYLDRNGDLYLTDHEELCGTGTFTRKSSFHSIVLAYISLGSQGRFECQLLVQPQKCDCGWSVNKKIINGEEASVNEYPSIVALRDTRKGGTIYCGASIISHRYLLTAAHCANFQPIPSLIEARVGSHNLESTKDTIYTAVYSIIEIIKHPSYKPDPVRNDIALMKTDRDIEFSRGVGPICLPPLSIANNNFAYRDVDVIGWGVTDFNRGPSPTLQKASVQVTDYPTCQRRYEDILPTHICTFDPMGTSKDSCIYDSGGPVIYKGNRQFLLGIISSGKACFAGNKRPMAINTRVTSYLLWIYANIDRSTCPIELLDHNGTPLGE